MASSWPIHGQFMANAWPVRGLFMANSWPLRGQCVANARAVHGQFTAKHEQCMGVERPWHGHQTSTEPRTNRTANNRPTRPKASVYMD
eukprot:11166486-Lingulodinium_polyedra.AAC.1